MDRKEIAAGLKAAGVKKGGIVLLHSSFLSLGEVKNGPAEVVKAFLDVLGKNGTLLVPAFGKLGVLVEEVKKLPGAIISTCPASAVAAIGPAAEKLCADHWKAETAHGEGTPYTRLAEMGGQICLLGVDQDRNTTLHSIEALLQLPYLKTIKCEVTRPNGKVEKRSYRFFPGPHRNFIGIDKLLADTGAMKTGVIGNAQVRLIDAGMMFETLLSLGTEHPDLFLCDNPACADCVRQRAAIYAADFASESFQLTASSRLAGRYVPEIVENLKQEGIGFVELDSVQGKICGNMSAAVLSDIVQEFRKNQIWISALRMPVIPDDPAALALKLKTAGIARVILPAAGITADVLTAFKKEKIAVSLTNIARSAKAAAEDMAAAKKIMPQADFVFNPAHFARVGENPFLTSWRVGRFIKTVFQLDIVDALWDGEPAELAFGNGEVKELISILRCSNFQGWFSLGGGAGYPGSLTEAADNFRDLIANM